jgi:hypothetical protein
LRRYHDRLTVILHVCHEIRALTRLCVSGEFAKAKVVALGVIHGLTFNPPVESIGAPFDASGIRTSLHSDSKLDRSLGEILDDPASS